MNLNETATTAKQIDTSNKQQTRAIVDPCPFCESKEVRLMSYYPGLSATRYLFIECKDCFARGPYIEYDSYREASDTEAISAIYWWHVPRLARKQLKSEIEGSLEELIEMCNNEIEAGGDYRCLEVRKETLEEIWQLI